MANAAQLERDLISTRTRDALAAMKRRGVRLGPKTRLTPKPVLRRVVRERDAGKTWQAIADGLNRDQVPTVRGGAMWRVYTVQQRTGMIEGQVCLWIREGWYVLVTSSSGKSVFAMLGPFTTPAIAEQKARDSCVVHFRVGSRSQRGGIQRMPHRHWFIVLTVNGVERRNGPYASRRTAERKSKQYKNAATADVKLVYDPAPLGHSGRY
jgi:hypothetical protein